MKRPLNRGTLERLFRPDSLYNKPLKNERVLNKVRRISLALSPASSGYRKANVTRHAGFGEGNVAASLTNNQIDRWGNPGYINTLIPVIGGSIIRLEVSLSSSRTNGTCTVTVYVENSATDLTFTIDSENPDGGFVDESPDVITYNEFEEIDIRITTTSSWSPTSADLHCVIWTVDQTT